MSGHFKTVGKIHIWFQGRQRCYITISGDTVLCVRASGAFEGIFLHTCIKNAHSLVKHTCVLVISSDSSELGVKKLWKRQQTLTLSRFGMTKSNLAFWFLSSHAMKISSFCELMLLLQKETKGCLAKTCSQHSISFIINNKETCSLFNTFNPVK